MKRWITFFIVLTVACSSALAAEEVTMTLEEAIVIGLRDNRDLQLKATEVEKAKALVRESQSEQWPTLTVTGSQQQTRSLYDDYQDQSTFLATFKHYLYKGGKVVNAIQKNQYNQKAQEAIYDVTKSDLIFSITKTFYTLAMAREYATLNQAVVANTDKHLAYLTALYNEGRASASEILGVRQSQEAVQKAYEESVNQVEALQGLLRQLLYFDESVTLNPVATLTYDPRELSYDEGFLLAMEDRPEIRQYKAQEEVARKAVEIAKASGRPSVHIACDYYYRSDALVSAASDWNEYEVFGVVLSWPIFDGWATKAKVDQAIIDLTEAQLSNEKIRKDIALEVKNAYINFKNAMSAVKTAQADIRYYQDRTSVVDAQYAKGIVSDLAQEDTRLSLSVAQFNQSQAVSTYLIAKAEFEKATGGF